MSCPTVLRAIVGMVNLLPQLDESEKLRGHQSKKRSRYQRKGITTGAYFHTKSMSKLTLSV